MSNTLPVEFYRVLDGTPWDIIGPVRAIADGAYSIAVRDSTRSLDTPCIMAILASTPDELKPKLLLLAA